MDERRPAPEVTVRDPHRPGQPADVLVSGDERPPIDPAVRRRVLRVGAALLVFVAVAVGVRELREWRADVAEERRLAAIVDLSATLLESTTSLGTTPDVAVLHAEVRVLNSGPRDLVVVGGRLGGFRVVQGETRLRPGVGEPIRLEQDVACSATSPPPPLPSGLLALDLRTKAGPRQVDVPLPVELESDAAARACGFLPLEEAVFVAVVDRQLTGPGMVLSLAVDSRSIRPVQLVEVTAGSGFAARVRNGELPWTLPQQSPGSTTSTRVELLLTVTDCVAARLAGPTPLGVRLEDERGDELDLLLGDEVGFLSPLLDSVCRT